MGKVIGGKIKDQMMNGFKSSSYTRCLGQQKGGH